MAVAAEYYVDPVGGNDTTGDGSIGTPWATVEKALTTITRTGSAGGDRINLKSGGTDTLSAQLSLTTYAATATRAIPLIIQGYTSAAGDGGIGVIDGGGSNAIFNASAFDYLYLVDLQLGNCGTADVVFCDNSCMAYNVYFHDCGRAFDCDDNCRVEFCRFEGVGHNTNADDCINTGADSVVVGNYFATGSNGWRYAINCTLRSTIMHNIISNTGSNTITGGIFVNNVHNVIACNSILTGASDGTGITGDRSHVWGNLVEGFSSTGGVGISTAGDESLIYAWNAVQNCDTAYDETGVSGYVWPDVDNETLSATPFNQNGSDTYANRKDYFAALDVGNVIDGVYNGTFSKGAVQTSQASGGGGGGISDYYSEEMGSPKRAVYRGIGY
jgi:hypothetical protein